jgi:hypothetical protein
VETGGTRQLLLLLLMMRRRSRVGGRKMVIRMRVPLEMLVLHRTHMLLLLLMRPTRPHVHTLKLIVPPETPIQLQRKQILMRSMMLVLCLDDLLWMVVGTQVRLEWEVCVALSAVKRGGRMTRMMKWGVLRRRR